MPARGGPVVVDSPGRVRRSLHAPTQTAQAGIHPKVVSERLGHATVAITLDTYSHAIPALQEEAAAKIAGLVFAKWAVDSRSSDGTLSPLHTTSHTRTSKAAAALAGEPPLP